MPTDPIYELSASSRKRGLIFLGLAVAAAGATMGIQAGLNFNFMVEEIGVTGLQMGGVEAARAPRHGAPPLPLLPPLHPGSSVPPPQRDGMRGR